jgi:hypothetical protein
MLADKLCLAARKMKLKQQLDGGSIKILLELSFRGILLMLKF